VPADHHLADEVQALEVEALSGETLILSQYEEDAGFADYVTDFVAAARPMPEQFQAAWRTMEAKRDDLDQSAAADRHICSETMYPESPGIKLGTELIGRHDEGRPSTASEGAAPCKRSEQGSFSSLPLSSLQPALLARRISPLGRR